MIKIMNVFDLLDDFLLVGIWFCEGFFGGCGWGLGVIGGGWMVVGFGIRYVVFDLSI